MKQGLITEIHTIKDGIVALKELYIKIITQRNIFINKEQNVENNIRYKNLTQDMLENIINDETVKDDRKTIQFLRNIIDDIFENEENPEIKQKLKGIFGTYYINLLDKVKKLLEPEKGEEILLNLIRKSKVKIHDDQSQKENLEYGDLIQVKKQIPEILYKDKNMMLIRINKYTTNKIRNTQGNNNKVRVTLDKEEVSKYEYQIVYEPNKIATIEYFGETNLGDKIKKGKIEYIAPMLAAVEKAKSAKREYIGKITKIFEELGTYVTQYDENLEQRIQELKLREEIAIKKSNNPKLKDKEER